jgi:hypothetical protein
VVGIVIVTAAVVAVATAGEGEQPCFLENVWSTSAARGRDPAIKGSHSSSTPQPLETVLDRRRRKVRRKGWGEACQEELDSLSPMY